MAVSEGGQMSSSPLPRGGGFERATLFNLGAGEVTGVERTLEKY